VSVVFSDGRGGDGISRTAAAARAGVVTSVQSIERSEREMSKYELARGCVADVVKSAAESGVTEDEMLETLIVVAVENLSRCAGRKRTADALRYELSNIGGDVDTVFLRSR
jgi:NAD+--asparagine ADP-ribosyltransferase